MIGLLGNGSWATAIAKILTDNGHAIHWWMRSNEALQSLALKQHNYPYLSSIKFDPALVHATTDISEVIHACEDIIVCIPSAYLTDIISAVDPTLFVGKNIISAVKGIMPQVDQLLSDYAKTHWALPMERYVSITGPCHAEEIAMERLSYLTFSCADIHKAAAISALFGNDYLRTTINTDVQGTQYAAVLKNIYAIGAGIADGLGYGDNFMSVYVTNCYRELYGYIQHLDACTNDYHTSAYLGDLMVTCYSLHSRNRRLGTLIGKGYSTDAAITEMGMMAEGYFAARGMQHIIEKQGDALPIVSYIYKMLWEHALPKQIFKEIEKAMK